VAAIGYYVWHTQSETTKTLNTADSDTKSAATNTKKSTSAANTESLSGNVTYAVPANWEVAPDSALNSTAADRCDQSIDSTATCLDHSVLVLKSEGYTNSDQFLANISTYTKTNSDSLKEWFSNTANDGLGLGGETNSTITAITIDGQPAIKYEVLYPDDHEDRVSYAVVKGNVGVVIRSVLFSADHYSFKNTNNTDYTKYAPTIKALAQSVKFKS
jgi:hypothetical protein